MMATALASDPTLPAEAREQLDMMRRNIELEARLIDDLLDLTRISHGKLIIAPVTADIHELLQHTDEIIRSDGLGKRLHITLNLEASQHHALADPARLQQVFWNLLRNAVKFTPDGGTITVSSRNDAEGRIIISVADDGIGIRAEVLARIFDAFEQADATGEHCYGGLGLGLAISSAIVTAHGCEIKAESKGCGHGAEFTVTLGSVPAPAAARKENATPAQPARALSLLVVEDHEATRTVLERLLTRSGHQVTTAATVQEALTAFKAIHYDAVISDLGLPDGSGLDLMAQIQSIRPVPGIALSGYGMEDDIRRTREAGFAAHLVKPVNINELCRLVEQLAPGTALKT
jgi:CheY-like chemotaxis protein